MIMTEFGKQPIEIMAPAGSYESLRAAIQGGADSVYFGAGKLNMRSRSSQNFGHDDLARIAEICHTHGIQSYLTLNTIVYDEELGVMRGMVDEANKANISAVIASDLSVMEYARACGLRVHISTQCNITNLEAVRFYARFADVMVLARELRLEQVLHIAKAIDKEHICGPSGELVKLEVFVHGALCMAVSGKCYLSLDNMNYSANRGACLQLCRRSYLVTDKEEGYELEVDHAYIMSPKDLCTIGFLDKIMQAGVKVFKIEGRGRGPDYVKTATRCYREAVASIQQGSYSREKVDAWTNQLRGVFNRGFWSGYYLGRSMGEWSERYGSQSTRRKQYIGRITNYYSRLGVAEITIETGGFSAGDTLMITGPTTGVLEVEPKEIRVDHTDVHTTCKGEQCSVKVPELVRRGDKVFRIEVAEDKF